MSECPCFKCANKCPYEYNGWMAYDRCDIFIKWVDDVLKELGGGKI
jgi:hypothetical protein